MKGKRLLIHPAAEKMNLKEGKTYLVDVASKVGEHEWIEMIYSHSFNNPATKSKFYVFETSEGLRGYPEKDRLGNILIKEKRQ